MRYGAIAGILTTLFSPIPGPSSAQEVPAAVGGSGGAATGTPPPGTAVGAVGGGGFPQSGPIVIGPPPGVYYWVPGPFGPVPYIPPTYVIAPGGGFFPPPFVVAPPPALQPLGGPIDVTNPVAEAVAARVLQDIAATVRRQEAARAARAAQPMARRLDPARAGLMITVGDRLVRAGDLNRAVARYEQALAADPFNAGTRLRLAQVAVIRGDYAEAANQLREAEAADPGYLLRHPFDVQGLHPEPADFAALIERIESHLVDRPNDRDATLVLGAQLYLSGRTARAADVLRRLTDRKPDPTLAAFLEAARAVE